MLKLTTDKHEASRGLSATAELLVHKALNNLSAYSLDHLSVSSRHTRACNKNKFVSLPVRTDVFKYSFFPRPLPIGIPCHWLFVSCSRISPSTGLCRTRHPPAVADYHTPAVTSGLHSLLDIAPKNRRINFEIGTILWLVDWSGFSLGSLVFALLEIKIIIIIIIRRLITRAMSEYMTESDKTMLCIR